MVGVSGTLVESRRTNVQLHYAVPIDDLKPFLEDTLARPDAGKTYTGPGDKEPEEEGPGEPGYHGITVLKAGINLATPAYVDRVAPRSPGAKAGVQPDDLILKIDRTSVKKWKTFQKMMAKYRAGESAQLTIKRKEEVKVLTDLTIGLPQGHRWIAARMPAENGVDFTANMPTEEIFTLPDRYRADGTVAATFPLSYGGSLIEDFSVTFENGKIIKVNAKKNEAILQRLIDSDEGSTRLGEVALVPASSPIATRGHLFYNTLFDENASCHLAVGRAYRFTLTGGEELNDEEFIAAGGNVSLNHVDFMIGSPQMDIDGIKEDGTLEPIMRSVEWAF